MRDKANGKTSEEIEKYDLDSVTQRESMKDQDKIFKRVTVFSDIFWHDCRRRRIYTETKIV